MKFRVYGPFRILRTKGGAIAPSATERAKFWDEVDDTTEGLSEACGCYVFCLRAGGGTKPWYVGKAERTSFRRECLNSHKLVHYNRASVGRKGRPLLYLVAQVTPKGLFRRPTTTKRAAISALETILISTAVSRNEKLLNVSGTKMSRKLVVHGVLNSKGRGPKGAGTELKRILGLG